MADNNKIVSSDQPMRNVGSIVSVYAHKHIGMTEVASTALNSAFVGILFSAPMLTGFLASRFGYGKTIIVGCILNILAFVAAIVVKSDYGFYLAASAVVVSLSAYYPPYLVLLGRMFGRQDSRREAAYTLSYMMMNVGIFIGGANMGTIVAAYSYPVAFAVLIGCSIVSLLVVFLSLAYYQPDDEFAQSTSTGGLFSNIGDWLALIVAMVVLVPVCAWLLEHDTFTNYLLIVAVSAVGLGLLIYGFMQPDKKVRSHMIVYVVLCVASVGFWSLYSLEPSLITLFVDNSVDRRIFQHLVPASDFYSLESLFIVLLAIPFSMLWVYLARRDRDPSLPAKFSMSLWVMGFGFIVLTFGIWATPAGDKINLWWVVLSYIFLSSAELLISPVGNAMVGRLAPPKLEGFMMGTWQGFSGLSAAVSGLMAGMFAMPTGKESLQVTDPIYAAGFGKLGLMTMGMGLLLLLLLPWLKRNLTQHEGS